MHIRNGHWRTQTDIDGQGRTLVDLDGHWWTWTDIGGLGRTRVAKGRPRVQNRISKGSCGLQKLKKYFRLIMIRVA